MWSLSRWILAFCFWRIALCSPRQSECLFALVLLFGDMASDFFAVL